MKLTVVKFLNVFLFLIISFHASQAQNEGSFIIDNHYRDLNESDGIHFEIISDHDGLISSAHNQGVFQYDGNSWEFFQTPTAAVSLENDDKNNLYVGCVDGFGKLSWDDYKINYMPIYKSDSISELFFQTKYNNGKVYFLSEKSLFIYDVSQGRVVRSFLDKFLNLFVLDDQVYVNSDEKSFKIEQNELVEIDGLLSNLKIIRAINLQKQGSSVVLNDEGLLFYKTLGDKYLPLKVNPLITEYDLTITDIQPINDTLLVGSTLDMGCVFINPKTDYFEVLDNTKGLADNEIFSIHVDKQGGVWVSHEQGLSRILVSFPAKDFSHLPGIHGNLLSIQRLNSQLWLSSNSGIYYFDTDTTYKTRVYYVVKKSKSRSKRKPKKTTTSTAKITTAKEPTSQKATTQQKTASSESTKKSKKKKRGFFKKLFGSKKSKAKEDTQKQSNQKNKEKTTNSETQEEPKKKRSFFAKLFNVGKEKSKKGKSKIVGSDLGKGKVYIRKTEKIPVRTTKLFKKVPGLSGKCKKLIQFDNRLLGASTSGLIEIKNNEAQVVIEEPIIDVVRLAKTNSILILTYDQQVKLYELSNEVWIEQIVYNPKSIIKSLYQDKSNNVWLIGSSDIFKLKIADQISIEKEYTIENQRFDNVLLANINEKMFFINSQGFFVLDEASDKIIPFKEWMDELGKPTNYFCDANGVLWIFNDKNWFEIAHDGVVTTHQNFSLFPKLKMITYDKGIDKYWLVTGKNKLLAFDHTLENADTAYHSLFLRQIKTTDGILYKEGSLVVNHDNTYLSFEMSKPDYLGMLKTEYRYKLSGMNESWSDWSNNSKIDFSYLKPGSYTLYVQSKDSFGKMEESEPISFRVKTPYWETPWFYALQALLFSGLIFLSSRLKSNERNRFLKGALSVLTIVLIIEFLQSTMAAFIDTSSNPVISFLVDVGTALLVFPVEKLLHKFLYSDVSIKELKNFKELKKIKNVIKKDKSDDVTNV